MDLDMSSYVERHDSTKVDLSHFEICYFSADILEETSKIILDAGMNSVLPKPEPMYAFEESLRIMMQRATTGKD